MASSTAYPSAETNDATLGTVSWSFASGTIYSNNDTYAQVELSTGQRSKYLVGYNFGFSIPTDAEIVGIVVTIRRFASDPGPGTTLQDASVKLYYLGAPAGEERADTGTQWEATETEVSYGGVSDLWWLTPTYDEINSVNFGACISADANGGMSSAIGYVDSMTITVYYNDASTGTEGYQTSTVPVQQCYDFFAAGSAFGDMPFEAIINPSTVADMEWPPTPYSEQPTFLFDDESGDWFSVLAMDPLSDPTALLDWLTSSQSFDLQWDIDGAVDWQSLGLDPSVFDAHACGCGGTIAVVSVGCGTITHVNTTTDEFDEELIQDVTGTVVVVSAGCGTVAVVQICEC